MRDNPARSTVGRAIGIRAGQPVSAVDKYREGEDHRQDDRIGLDLQYVLAPQRARDRLKPGDQRRVHDESIERCERRPRTGGESLYRIANPPARSRQRFVRWRSDHSRKHTGALQPFDHRASNVDTFGEAVLAVPPRECFEERHRVIPSRSVRSKSRTVCCYDEKAGLWFTSLQQGAGAHVRRKTRSGRICPTTGRIVRRAASRMVRPPQAAFHACRLPAPGRLRCRESSKRDGSSIGGGR
jgi:hypothetical protein